MPTLIVCFFVLIINSCVKKDDALKNKADVGPELVHEQVLNKGPSSFESQLSKKGDQKSAQEFYATESFLDAITMAGNIEKESYKLSIINAKVQQKQVLQLNTLSYALNYVFRRDLLPKNFPLDCKVYTVGKIDDTSVEVFRSCIKPATAIAKIQANTESSYNITFYQQHWKSVIGSVALMNSKPRVCNITIKDAKLQTMICKDTVYTLDDKSGLEEMRWSDFRYNKSEPHVIQIKGARYKDFSERSQIDIKVPASGKIKVFEKELEFHDEFEDILKER